MVVLVRVAAGGQHDLLDGFEHFAQRLAVLAPVSGRVGFAPVGLIPARIIVFYFIDWNPGFEHEQLDLLLV